GPLTMDWPAHLAREARSRDDGGAEEDLDHDEHPSGDRQHRVMRTFPAREGQGSAPGSRALEVPPRAAALAPLALAAAAGLAGLAVIRAGAAQAPAGPAPRPGAAARTFALQVAGGSGAGDYP